MDEYDIEPISMEELRRVARPLAPSPPRTCKIVILEALSALRRLTFTDNSRSTFGVCGAQNTVSMPSAPREIGPIVRQRLENVPTE
jgi:hypothetical protein